MPLKPVTAMRKDKSTGKFAGVQMQHRHFAFIANVIASLPTHAPSLRAQKSSIASAFAEALVGTNPNFDRARFFTAVGIDDPYMTQAAYGEDLPAVEKVALGLKNLSPVAIRALGDALREMESSGIPGIGKTAKLKE